MISLPDAIVIYPEKSLVPGYLLCWVPAREYNRMAQSAEAAASLKKFYPKGVEFELSEDGLGEHNLDLGTAPADLRQAYLDLHGENLLPETGMVTLEALEAYLEAQQNQGKEEVTAELMGVPGTLQGPGENELLSKLLSPPPMTPGQQANQVYRRLDPAQVMPEEPGQGGRDGN